ncbi:TerB family tellurite resistance protein [Haliea sp. E17]|uniref:TerB family tellurite resistance protein n=1 Tax=Haliea sp. E17 TaxID=3401576 RepID=UPI003AAAE716
MQIDTEVIRRLRDALLAQDSAADQAPGNVAAPRREAALARVAPFAETMYLVMMADGHHAPEELASVRGAIRLLAGDLLDAADLDALLDRCDAAARERGPAFLLQALGNRLCANRNDRETAFTLAAAVALADDTVVEEEQALLGDVAEWFGVSSRRARELLGEISAPGR